MMAMPNRRQDCRWPAKPRPRARRWPRWPMLPASGWGELGDELDDAPRGAAAGIQVRVVDRQAPAGAAAVPQNRRTDRGELLPGQPAGQHDLAGSATGRELAARQDIEVDMQPPPGRLRRDVLDGHAGVAWRVRGHLAGRAQPYPVSYRRDVRSLAEQVITGAEHGERAWGQRRQPVAKRPWRPLTGQAQQQGDLHVRRLAAWRQLHRRG